MATREPPVEMFYDPAELDPDAPRLHIRKDDDVWVLRDADGAQLSSHAKLPEAIDAAEARSKEGFCEILVRGAVTPTEWSVRLNPAMAALARVLNQPVLVEQKAGEGRPRVGVGAFPGHYKFLPIRRRRPESGNERRVELFYDPAELEPDVPRLYIRKENGVWELRDDGDVVLSRHVRLPGAMDAALARSAVSFCEILVRTADGEWEWSLRHNPDWTELARMLNRPIAAEQEAAD
ncbi:MAG TPA: hypothetical protein VLK84_07770 [Longimicrobium sp.]|nr:hypothetical protein [Longimicrobium sp.]